MRILGVDLAWGPRGRTGLCAIDDGRVLDSVSVVTDADVDAWIRRFTADEMLVAIDAPIVVANETGCRPSDWVLASAYGREHAGPHPANRSMQSFRDGTRAFALAQRFGLAVDPARIAERPLRLAIEVYPHPALVGLFTLGTTLKYKAKRHRDRAARRLAFDELLRCLAKLAAFEPPLDVTTSPRWPALCAEVDGATTGAALDRAEDELDAYLCAYVGLYHLRWHGVRSLTVGDVATGYIVTPVDQAHADLLRARATQRGVAVT